MMRKVRTIPRSRAIDLEHMAWAAPFAMPTNSASPDDKAMVACVVDRCRTIWEPILMRPPDVHRRVL